MMYNLKKLINYKKEITKKDLLAFYNKFINIIDNYKDINEYTLGFSFNTETQSCNSFEEFENEIVLNFKYNYFSFILVCIDKNVHETILSINFSHNFGKDLIIYLTARTIVKAEELIEDIGNEISKLKINDENKDNITKVEIYTSSEERKYIESKETIKDKIEKYRFWIGILLGGLVLAFFEFTFKIILNLLNK